jgi:hypothetical protein
MAGTRPNRSLTGRVAIGVVAIAAFFAMTAVYHLG